MLGGEVAAGIFQLERARNRRAEVVFGKAAAGQQGLGIGERPAPTIKADDALKVRDRFVSDRFAVEA